MLSISGSAASAGPPAAASPSCSPACAGWGPRFSFCTRPRLASKLGRSCGTQTAAKQQLHCTQPVQRVPSRTHPRPSRVRAVASANASTSSSAASGDGPSSSGTSADAVPTTATATAVATAAATAVVGAVAVAAAPPPQPSTTAPRLLSQAFALLRGHLPAVLLLYALRDGVSFILHRLSQRLTNHVAELLLGAPTSTAGNPWWLYLNQEFIRANPGYEVLVGVFFLLFLPFSIALNSVAFTAAALVCTRPEERAAAAAAGPAAGIGGALAGSSGTGPGGAASAGETEGRRGLNGAVSLEGDPSAASLADIGIQALPPTAEAEALLSPPPRHPAEDPSADASAAAAAALTASESLDAGEEPQPPSTGEGAGSGGPIAALRSAIASIAAVLPEAAAAVRRVWWADMHLNARALPLQGLCLLVIPAVWAVPRLLRMQLALPVALLEGRKGRDALDRSAVLVGSSLSAYGIPFSVLLAAIRLIEYVQNSAMALVPPRYWREVVEVPLFVAGGFLLLKACLARLQDLLPLAAYLDLSQQEAEGRRKQREEIAAALLPPTQQQGESLEEETPTAGAA